MTTLFLKEPFAAAFGKKHSGYVRSISLNQHLFLPSQVSTLNSVEKTFASLAP